MCVTCGVPTNSRALDTFRHHLIDIARRALRRRSQKDRTRWEDMDKLAERWCLRRGYPTLGLSNASASNTQGGSRMQEFRPYGSMRGAPSSERPYRD
jgi:hypothetical protein